MAKIQDRVSLIEAQVIRKIKITLIERDIDQQDLCGWIGVSPPWLSRRLHGQIPIKLSDLQLIFDALGEPLRLEFGAA